MSDKHYIGLDVTSFENTGKHKPVSRVTLFVDEENYYTSGDDTGKEITASCPSATQEMANTLLAKFVGYEHQSFNADSANIDPAAELGDGVTVGGIYATLSRVRDDGTGYAGLAAADEPEIEEEYPYLSPIQQEINRNSTEIRSLITKTAEEIALRVTSEEAEALIQAKLEGITISVSSGESGTKVSITSGGVTISSAKVDLQVDAANINGLLTADQIETDGITASIIKGNSVNLLTDDENTAGTLQMTGASTANYAVELDSKGALRLVAGAGSAYISGSGSALDLSYYASFAGNIGPSDDGAYSCGLPNRAWSAVYAESSEIVTSDANRKHDIEDLPEKYAQLVLWLTPKRFKLNSGTSGRDHVGFTAQDVKAGMDLFGIDPLEFGGWCEDKDSDGNPIYMLRYEEFIAILAAVTQDHEARLKALEGHK